MHTIYSYIKSQRSLNLSILGNGMWLFFPRSNLSSCWKVWKYFLIHSHKMWFLEYDRFHDVRECSRATNFCSHLKTINLWSWTSCYPIFCYFKRKNSSQKLSSSSLLCTISFKTTGIRFYTRENNFLKCSSSSLCFDN